LLANKSLNTLVADAMASGTSIEGVDGLVNQMTKAVLERALEAEMTHEWSMSGGIRPVMVRGITLACGPVNLTLPYHTPATHM
jgi:hypothetical protein